MSKTVILLALSCSALSISGFFGPASAQETERSRPWVKLDGRNVGAVGTCPDVDGGEGDTCYIVRCSKDDGALTFVIQHPGIADDDPRKIKITIGKTHSVIPLEKHADDERTFRLRSYPKLLKAMTSGEKYAALETVEAGFEYSTTFELTDAARRIGPIAASCKQ